MLDILTPMRFLIRFICLCALLSSPPADAGTLARFRTPLGEIEVELFDFDKPVTVQNFISYVQSGAYKDSFVHRWEPGFVIQGGGYMTMNRHATNAGVGPVGTFGTITNEYQVGRTFSNTYGTIAMARESGKTNSATSQWFFNLGDNSELDQVDGGFTVFGQVHRGTNVLNRFNNAAATNGIYMANVPGLFNRLPVLVRNATLDDLVYTDISLLTVQIARPAAGQPEITWESVSNKVNRVEFTTQIPPVWQELASTNGNGQIMRVTDPSRMRTARFYRVRVDY